jgi:hypothetical protein
MTVRIILIGERSLEQIPGIGLAGPCRTRRVLPLKPDALHPAAWLPAPPEARLAALTRGQ